MPFTFRHSYARHLLLHGVPINYLSKWLGHRSIRITLICVELVPDPAGRLSLELRRGADDSGYSE